MGYFSEMSLDMQEGRKPSAASLLSLPADVISKPNICLSSLNEGRH